MFASTLSSRQHVFGIFLACAGSLTISFSGVLARQLQQADDWQIIFYRSVGLFCGLSGLLVFRQRTRVLASLRSSMRPALVAGPLQALSSIFFILALTHTTIANTVLTQTAIPVLAAWLGWVFLKERLELSTILALVGVIVGISVMTTDGLSGTGGLGNIFALLCAILFSAYLILIRALSIKDRGDLLPIIIFAAVLSGTAAAVAAKNLSIPRWDIAVCLFWGAAVQAVGTACILTAARHVPVVQLALINLAEPATAPIWGWLFVGERPTTVTVFGGVVTLTVTALWLVRTVLQRRHST